MQNDALSHGLWEMTASPAPPTSPLMARCGQTWRLSAAAIRGSRRRCIALRPGPRLSLWRRSRSVSAAPGATSAWSTPACGLRLTMSRRGLGPTMASGCSNCSAMGPSEVEALVTRHGLDCEFVRNGTLHCAIGPSGLAKIEERCAQWGSARRAGEASQPRGDGAADRRQHLRRLIARPARRDDPAAGLRARACARGARRRRGDPHAERGAFGRADGQGLAPQDRRRNGDGGLDRSRHGRLCRRAGLGRRESGSRSACPISISPPAH